VGEFGAMKPGRSLKFDNIGYSDGRGQDAIRSRVKGKKHMKRNKKTKGVTVVEYAVMLALIAIAVAVAAPNITSAVVGVFSKASSVMDK
jgi:Flp pilus assembly pilin Flp